jgi:hypothetical protein
MKPAPRAVSRCSASASWRRPERSERFAVDEHEALGFEPSWREDETRVTGSVDLADLERLAEHEGVERILYGSKGHPTLDLSIPAVRASMVRARTTTGFFGATGAGALVGIIDSGIDISVTEVLAILRDHAQKTPAGTDEEYGGGRLDVKAALEAVKP